MSQDRCSLQNRCFSMDYFSNSWVGHKISSNSRMKMTENTHFHLLGMGSLNGLMETLNYMVLILLCRQHFSPKHWTDVLAPISSIIKIKNMLWVVIFSLFCFLFFCFFSVFFFSVCLFLNTKKLRQDGLVQIL